MNTQYIFASQRLDRRLIALAACTRVVHDARVNAPHVARGRFCPGLKYAVQVSLVAIEHSPLRHAVTTTPSGALPLVFLRVCDLSAPCCRHLTTRGTRREERVGQREERVAQTITGLSTSLLAMCTQASKTPAAPPTPSTPSATRNSLSAPSAPASGCAIGASCAGRRLRRRRRVF